MRTKTLVFTAALGTVGIASALAQPVYSVNAVGYVNTPLKPAYNLVSNPLDAGAGNNVVDKLFAAVPDGTVFYKYDLTANPPGFFSFSKDFGAFDRLGVSLEPGEGIFVRNLSGADFTVTFVGEVKQGAALTVNTPKGFAIVSSAVPQGGKISTDLKYPPEEGDIVYQFNAATQQYKQTSYEFGAWGDGTPAAEPVVGVGEAFWSRKAPSSTQNWTRSFSVNP